MEESEEGWFDNLSDYMPVIEYITGAIILAYREFDRRMAICNGKDNKENRIERLLSKSGLTVS